MVGTTTGIPRRPLPANLIPVWYDPLGNPRVDGMLVGSKEPQRFREGYKTCVLLHLKLRGRFWIWIRVRPGKAILSRFNKLARMSKAVRRKAWGRFCAMEPLPIWSVHMRREEGPSLKLYGKRLRDSLFRTDGA